MHIKEIQPYVDLPALEEIQQKPHIKDENGNITHNVVSLKFLLEVMPWQIILRLY